MGKIKGWTVVTRRPTGIAWKNDHSGRAIQLIKINSDWQVRVGAKGSSSVPTSGGGVTHFKSKERALSFARSMMRRHPNG